MALTAFPIVSNQVLGQGFSDAWLTGSDTANEVPIPRASYLEFGQYSTPIQIVRLRPREGDSGSPTHVGHE